MKKLIIEPMGWPCKLRECPPGHFVYGAMLGFKTEYGAENEILEAYCDSGEFFIAGISSAIDRVEKIIVQPVEARWVEEEV